MRDLEQVKIELLKKFQSITSNEKDKLFVRPMNSVVKIQIQMDYDLEVFGFDFLQFVEKVNTIDAPGRKHSAAIIGLCAGVGKGCPKYPENEQLWFLFEDEEGIRHFCELRTAEELKGEVITLLETPALA